MNKESIVAIRVLPSDKHTFKTEQDFKFFIENTMISRGGLYYFPNSMMKCQPNTLVLFQYDGMVRAVGVLLSAQKTSVVDERGIAYAGYYRFDTSTLKYLSCPIDVATMKTAYPSFLTFNQSKQIIPLQYLDRILSIIHPDFYLNDEELFLLEEIEQELENIVYEGIVKEAIVKCRVNQNVFRDKLLSKYSRCCLCGVENPKLLVASHIKPWSASESIEKLDIDNGLLMCPNHDKLFDNGLISFDDNGDIIISKYLTETDKIFMNVHNDMWITLSNKNKKYLEYHRAYVFKE